AEGFCIPGSSAPHCPTRTGILSPGSGESSVRAGDGIRTHDVQLGKLDRGPAEKQPKLFAGKTIRETGGGCKRVRTAARTCSPWRYRRWLSGTRRYPEHVVLLPGAQGLLQLDDVPRALCTVCLEVRPVALLLGRPLLSLRVLPRPFGPDGKEG